MLCGKSCFCIYLVGEIFELKAELNSDKKDRKKEAVKKVIASMTVGKDVRCVEKKINCIFPSKVNTGKCKGVKLHGLAFSFAEIYCVTGELSFFIVQ